MIAQIKAELLKIRSTRTTIGLVLGMIALVLLFALLGGLLTKPPDLRAPEDQRGQLGVGSLAGVFSALAGIMLVTSEYRFGTIRPTFLFNPRRSRVLGAKLAAGLLAGIVLRARRRRARVRDRLRHPRRLAASPFALDAGQTALLLLGTLAGIALWGAIGVGSARSSATRSAPSSGCWPGGSWSRTCSSPSFRPSVASRRSMRETQ